MKKKIFMLLTLVMTAMTASAYKLTAVTDPAGRGTISFNVAGVDGVSEAAEGQDVYVTIAPTTGWVVNMSTGKWGAADALARRMATAAPADDDVELLDEIGLTFVTENATTRTRTYKFTMERADAEISCTYKKLLTHEDITILPIADQTYTGEAIEPTITVKDGSPVLTLGTDYTVTYSSNVNAALKTATENAPTVTITAVSTSETYAGETSVTFTILPKALEASMIGDITAVTYNTEAFTPEPAVTYNSMTLAKGTDFTYGYSNNTNAALSTATENAPTVTISAVANGNYSGSASKTFTINPATLTAATLEETNLLYDKTELSAVVASVTAGTLPVPSTDYDVTNNSATNVGNYTAIITGKNNFTGSVETPFSIVPAAAQLFTLTVEPDEFTYDATEKIPAVTVKDGDDVLTLWNEETQTGDYALTITNNVNAGTATVTATGKGNYVGTQTATFTIDKAELTVTADNKSVTFGDAKPTFTVSYEGFAGNDTEANLGGTLSFDCDYVQNQSGVGSYAITPKGLTADNYNIGYEDGTLTVGKKSFGDGDVSITVPGVTYTGKPLTPAPTVRFHGMTLVEGTDYTTEYSDNVDWGTGKATIKGQGNYDGEAEATFNISRRDLNDDNIKIAYIYQEVYDTEEHTPRIEVRDGLVPLVLGVDYKVTFRDNVEAGSARVTFEGLGNYKGKVKKYFNIKSYVIDAEMIQAIADQAWTGEAVEPAVTVVNGTMTLTEGKDYTVKYKNNVNEGTATVIVNGTGNFRSIDLVKTFKIVKKAETEADPGTIEDPGNATAIAAPAAGGLPVGTAYTLGGLKAKANEKGVVIIDGRLVLKK